MGQVRKELIPGWANGVVNTFYADAGPTDSARTAEDSTLTRDGAGNAVVSVRPGWEFIYDITSPLRGLFPYRHFDSITNSYYGSSYLITVRKATSPSAYELGRLRLSDNTFVSLGTLSPGSGSLPDDYPGAAQANNILYIAGGDITLSNGVISGMWKVRGTTLERWGIDRPSTAPTIADAGTAGAHSGKYEARVTFYNSNTGHESSAGPTSSQLTITNKDIAWSSVPVSSDSQVTHRYLYLRNANTMTQFYKVAEIANNTATTATTDVADSLLIIAGPDTAENDPPATNIYTLAWHKSRMFTSDGRYLYFSKLGDPESFDPDSYEVVNTDDGQRIMALVPYNGDLLIFKERATYALIGDDPNTWEIRDFNRSLGCVNHNAWGIGNNMLYVWTHRGPALVREEEFSLLGQELLADTMQTLEFSAATTVACGVAEVQDLILWAVSLDGNSSENTVVLPFNYKLQRFEASRWYPLQIAAFGAAILGDRGGEPTLYAGLQVRGGVFKLSTSATRDGFVGTAAGAFTAASSSITSLTDLSASFTTGTGSLVGGPIVRIWTGTTLVAERPLTSFTATQLNWSTPVAVTSGASYTYTVGVPNFSWTTQWLSFGDPFTMKRFQFVFVEGGWDGTLEIYSDENTATPKVTKQITTENTRVRCGFSAKAIQLKFFNTAATPNREMLVRAAVQFETRDGRQQ
jgi:hypothetical protein